MVKPTDYSESGQPIYRYEDKEHKEWIAPDYGEEGWSEKIEQHFEKYIGNIDNVFHEIISDLIHIDVFMMIKKNSVCAYRIGPSSPFDHVFGNKTLTKGGFI
jgi:hypothetical protein